MKMRTLFLLAVLALPGCNIDRTSGTGTGPGDPTPPATPIAIAGAWTYTVTVSNESHTASCDANGMATLNQNGTQFSGALAFVEMCTPDATVNGSYTATFTSGNISGSFVTFTSNGCVYTGTGSGSPPNALGGGVTCTFRPDGVPTAFTGMWQASR